MPKMRDVIRTAPKAIDIDALASAERKASDAFHDMLDEMDEDDETIGTMLDKSQFWVLDGGVIVSQLATGFGPNEPPIVWNGERWFSEEDDLSAEEQALVDRIRLRFPGWTDGDLS